MADSTNSNRESTFGRELTKYVSSYLPYTGYSMLDRLTELNPKFEVFFDKGAKQQENLTRKSIFGSPMFDDPTAEISQNRDYFNYMYANVQPDKGKRLMEYRVMAAYSEVADALDEICDETINVDRDGNIVKINITDNNVESEAQDKIREEFKKYVGYYELNKKGWEYFRQLLVDSEVYFEHIIHKDKPKEGILGVIPVPSDVIDPVFQNAQNQQVKAFVLRKPVLDSRNPNKVKEIRMIPLDQNQITYINSGIWNENKTIRLPFIENARRAYRQLSLIEDAIVIYRLVRAPERLVFNVDVGNMAPPKAEAYLKKLMNQYWSKKTFDADQNSIVNKFTPQSMLDNFWFAKRQGSEGTTVTPLAGGQNLGQLDDLVYFVKKLYKALKVPTTRVAPDDGFKDGTDILREELKFARFVIRLQQRFAQGLKAGFIVHLKLRDWWKEYGLKEHSFELEFNVPTNFYELRESQKLQLKFENFNTLTQNESISKTYGQKKYLGWTDHEVLANREFLRKDAEFIWELEQIKGQGPNWRQAAQTAEAPAAGGGGGGFGMPAGGGLSPVAGGEETPPEFGPAPGPTEAPAAPGAGQPAAPAAGQPTAPGA